MNLSDFGYDLPENLIAQHPLSKRDQARLMVIDRRQKTIRHDTFVNLSKYLPAKSCLVFNDSKVIAARLLGTKRSTGGKVEVFLLNKLGDGSYKTLLRPLRRVSNGEIIDFKNNGVYAQVMDWQTRTVRFNKSNISSFINRVGHMPLPPYIKRKDVAKDRRDYQTVYARQPGSVASPTAGLHFTRPLMNRLKKAGHRLEMATLHVNYATFKAVEEPDITRHKMHSEEFSITSAAFNRIKQARQKGNAIVTVGTTSCRVLETVASRGMVRCASYSNNEELAHHFPKASNHPEQVSPKDERVEGSPQRNSVLEGTTDIFIYPGYTFKMVDILITNFHLPYSTLLMLVYAFGGKELMAEAYRQAIAQQYRFYSYGDGMIIL